MSVMATLVGKVDAVEGLQRNCNHVMSAVISPCGCVSELINLIAIWTFRAQVRARRRYRQLPQRSKRKQYQKVGVAPEVMEASPGIEPGYKDLQSSA